MTGSIGSVPELCTDLNTSPPSKSPQTPGTEYGNTPAGRLGFLGHHTERPPAFVLPQIYDETNEHGQNFNDAHGSEIFPTPKYARPLEDFGTIETGSPTPRAQVSPQSHRQATTTKLDPLHIFDNAADPLALRVINNAQNWAGLHQSPRPIRHGDLSYLFPAVFENPSRSALEVNQPTPQVTRAMLNAPQYHQNNLESALRRPDALGSNPYIPGGRPFLRPPPGLPFPNPAPAVSLKPLPAPRPSSRNQVSKFRPMAALGALGRPTNLANAPGAAAVDNSTFSENYRGEHNWRNASAVNLPDKDNCALWLTNLPADITYHELLAPIRNIGRIWCTVINDPDWIRHDTAAAKVVFSNPKSAQILLEQSITRGLEIRDHHVRITRNRVKYPEKAMSGRESRVLIITGKSSFVNEESLRRFFGARFVYEVDEVVPLIVNAAGRSVVEFKFGSYRSQSQMGKMALERDRPEGFEKVEFGEDPCEVGDTLSSYEIAGRRIVGRGD